MTLTYSIDVSNWNDPDLSAIIAQHQPTHVVVRLSTESQQHIDIARQQLASAIAAGCSVAGYCWAYWDLSPTEHTAHALSVADGFPVDLVWFDCEDPTNGQLDDWLSRAVSLVESRGKRAGVYTRRGWWEENGDSRSFARLPLWVAQYDEVPTLESVVLFGGWESAAGKQWSTTGGTLDRDVFDSAVLMSPDPCATLRAGLQAITAARPYKAPPKKKLLALLG